MRVEISTINEEFEKSQVKGFVRTRKGKLERVNPFSRKGEKAAIERRKQHLTEKIDALEKQSDRLWNKMMRTSYNNPEHKMLSRQRNRVIDQIVKLGEDREHADIKRPEIRKFDFLSHDKKKKLQKLLDAGAKIKVVSGITGKGADSAGGGGTKPMREVAKLKKRGWKTFGVARGGYDNEGKAGFQALMIKE